MSSRRCGRAASTAGLLALSERRRGAARTPTRFGKPASQLRAFIDRAGPLWFEGKLADKGDSVFTASKIAHRGQEFTILSLGNTFDHWGGIIVPPQGRPRRLTVGRRTGAGQPTQRRYPFRDS